MKGDEKHSAKYPLSLGEKVGCSMSAQPEEGALPAVWDFVPIEPPAQVPGSLRGATHASPGRLHRNPTPRARRDYGPRLRKQGSRLGE